MMYIEEFIHRLACDGAFLFADAIPLDSTDRGIINSLAEQCLFSNHTVNVGLAALVPVAKPLNSGLTEKQRHFALRLVRKYAAPLSTALGMDVLPMINDAQFKLPVRVLNENKHISIATVNSQKVIRVQFPYSDEITGEFKEYRKTLPNFLSSEVGWSIDERAWVFGYTEQNILLLSGLLDAGFSADNEFKSLAEEIKVIADNIAEFIPTVVFDNGKFIFKNAYPTIPQPTSTDLIEVLVEARSYGITAWDDAIELALRELNPAVKRFLSNTAGVLAPNSSLASMADIIRYSGATMFVIPGGSELEHLQAIYLFLTNEGYANSDMSVMFRLDSGAGTLCNEFIKTNGLNNPISDDIKFVFVSGKMPKPLIAANKKIDIVVQFGLNSAHYTLKQYIRSHHNVVGMSLV